MLYGLSGMWLFSLILVLPLLVGVASTSKRLYQFLLDRGMSKNNAMTASVVALVMLAGVMSSPLFLGALPMRVLAGASYLYFLFIGTKQIIGFFSPPGDESRTDARRSPVTSPAKPAPREPDESCGCDHGDAGSENDTARGAGHSTGSADGAADGADGSGNGAAADGASDGLEQEPPARKTPPPQRPRRTPAEARAEIERRISESEKNGGAQSGDEKK